MSANPEKTHLAVTLGDPAGVGPEILVRAWRNKKLHENVSLVAIGHPEIIRRASKQFAGPEKVLEVAPQQRGLASPDVIACIAATGEEALAVAPATVDARGGQAAYDSLVLAAQLAQAGSIDGLVTLPLSKAALHKAGHEYPGHTELLGKLCGAKDVAMMLYLPPGDRVRGSAGLGVVHVTLHTAMRNIFGEITEEAILGKCKLAEHVMRTLKGATPQLAVCALNPHAGEEGLFGNEELRTIGPAVAKAAAAGIEVVGPLPTDTLMMRARDGEFDGVVAMYHDQGHIALKLLGMHQAVNVTLGLPIVRTSVAHGTAADLAWQGVADTGGLLAAIEVARKLASSSGFRISTEPETGPEEAT